LRIIPPLINWNDWNATTKRILDLAPNKKVGTNSLGYCNAAIVNNSGIGGLNTIGVFTGVAHAYWYPDYTVMGLTGSETLADANTALHTWLTNNPVYYTYQLATPATAQLVPIVADTWNGTTNITTDNVTKLTLTVEYLKR